MDCYRQTRDGQQQDKERRRPRSGRSSRAASPQQSKISLGMVGRQGLPAGAPRHACRTVVTAADDIAGIAKYAPTVAASLRRRRHAFDVRQCLIDRSLKLLRDAWEVEQRDHRWRQIGRQYRRKVGVLRIDGRLLRPALPLVLSVRPTVPRSHAR